MRKYDVTVIGGGPAGLAASLEANKNGSHVLLIEREAKLGGILKQCIHDGFGLMRFGEKLSGPEFVARDIEQVEKSDIEVSLLTFVTSVSANEKGFSITIVNQRGVETVFTKTIVLCTGCRERTAKQVMIHGTRPAGVITAGAAQNLVNLQGLMVTKKCVILGSGDIGLIMARRLTLEGAKVLGVYEVKPEPSGLSRNIAQCLNDYNIPLHLSHTVTRVFGDDRLEAVEVAKVDERMNPIPGTEKRIACDSLILSVGLIPENELAESLDCRLDNRTKGPHCDNHFMTTVPGIFAAGNCLHVNDLADYVSENGRLAGAAASRYVAEKKYTKMDVTTDDSIAYIVPQELKIGTSVHDREGLKNINIYFRSRKILRKATLSIELDGAVIKEKKYVVVRPPEMEKLNLDLSGYTLKEESKFIFRLTGDEAHD